MCGVIVHIGYVQHYRYNGWLFEYNRKLIQGAPWPCTKNVEPRKKAGYKFYKETEGFFKLLPDEQEKYRVTKL